MRGRVLRRFAVVAVCALSAVLLVDLPGASARSTSRPARPTRPAIATATGANTVSFSFDRWHPERTVVTSSAVYTRAGAAPLVLTITAQPSGKTVALTATVRNTSTGRVRFPAGGLRVDDAVVRNGVAIPGWTLRSARVTSLRPGTSVTVQATAPLPMPGNYDVAASAAYLR